MENLQIEYLPTAELLPYARNARKHTVKQVGQIAASILEFGFLNPIIIDKNKTIVAGHGRVMAAQQIALDKVPVIRAEHLTDAQRRAYTLVDNQLALNAEYDDELLKIEIGDLKAMDFDLELLGFDDLDKFLENETGTEGNTDPDDVPEVEKNIHGVERGDIWQLGDHRLMCGDSTSKDDVEKLMNGEKAEMVFTDPPYGVDVVGGDKAIGGGKIVKSNRYNRVIGDMNPDVAREVCTILVSLNISPMVIWGANNFAHDLPESSAWLYWQKNQTGDFADGELAWTNAKGQIKRFEHTWAGLIKASEHGEKRCHPTQKPIALAEWCFEKYEPKSKSVLDLFLGSGSTLIACEKTGRKCYGMEIDEHYCSVIIERWQNFTGKQAVKLNG